MNMQYENSSKLRSLKLNRRNSVIFAVMLLSLTAVAMPAAAEIINPSAECTAAQKAIDACPFLDDGENDGLELVTFFLFFVGYISMGAAFVFFMSERSNVGPEHRTTMTISALIVGIAAFHYYYMRGVYVDHQVVSIEYRYMDWIITVPLMALKFPSLVGKDAITDAKFLGMGFTGVCFTGALIMISFGYLGEPDSWAQTGASPWWCRLGNDHRCNWYSMVLGKGVDNDKIPEFMWSANALRWFIVVGWIIYPLGYLFSPKSKSSISVLKVN